MDPWSKNDPVGPRALGLQIGPHWPAGPLAGPQRPRGVIAQKKSGPKHGGKDTPKKKRRRSFERFLAVVVTCCETETFYAFSETLTD